MMKALTQCTLPTPIINEKDDYMYIKDRNGRYSKLNADYQTSIRIDKRTKEIIDSMEGRSFSDKIRNLACQYEEMKKDKLEQM